MQVFLKCKVTFPQMRLECINWHLQMHSRWSYLIGFKIIGLISTVVCSVNGFFHCDLHCIWQLLQNSYLRMLFLFKDTRWKKEEGQYQHWYTHPQYKYHLSLMNWFCWCNKIQDSRLIQYSIVKQSLSYSSQWYTLKKKKQLLNNQKIPKINSSKGLQESWFKT